MTAGHVIHRIVPRGRLRSTVFYGEKKDVAAIIPFDDNSVCCYGKSMIDCIELIGTMPFAAALIVHMYYQAVSF